MEIVLGLGAAIGVVVALMCALFYLRGVRDGMDTGKGRRPRLALRGGGTTDGEESEIGKKYEAILSYDPYETERSREQRGGGR